jgi:hypothetical protein
VEIEYRTDLFPGKETNNMHEARALFSFIKIMLTLQRSDF